MEPYGALRPRGHSGPTGFRGLKKKVLGHSEATGFKKEQLEQKQLEQNRTARTKLFRVLLQRCHLEILS